MSNKICGVYKITNIVNGKIYVGSSNDIEYRWWKHKYDLNSKIHKNTHLQNAWNKYKSHSFTFEIIEECSPQIQFEREQYYLDTLDPFDDNGYNIIRRISKEYMSDNYMTKECARCGNEYHTFSYRSKYCDKCKDEMTKESYQAFIEARKHYVNDSLKENDVIEFGYEDWDDFWECCI